MVRKPLPSHQERCLAPRNRYAASLRPETITILQRHLHGLVTNSSTEIWTVWKSIEISCNILLTSNCFNFIYMQVYFKSFTHWSMGDVVVSVPWIRKKYLQVRRANNLWGLRVLSDVYMPNCIYRVHVHMQMISKLPAIIVCSGSETQGPDSI